MLRKIEVAVLSVLACFAFAAAEQRQSLKIVPDTSSDGVRALGDIISVEWVQLDSFGKLQNPDPGDVYYAATFSGGDLAKYTKITPVADPKDTVFSGSVKKRVTRFIPNRQGGRMGAGVYYVIAAYVNGRDTLYSDYFRLMAASAEPPAIVSPKADVLKGELVKTVTDLAPIFKWRSVQGVPYYHIVLSDMPFINSDGKPNTGVNIIWQAITPNTQITYGAPDPSKTITSAPPPLAWGTTYSWMVLNNYGNRPEFTSWDVVSAMDGVAGRFLIGGDTRDTLKTPMIISPKPPDTVFSKDRRPTIEFKWGNLDTRATSYLVNLLREGTAETFGMEGMGDFKMGLLAWETTVPRGDETNALGVTFNAASTLTAGSYKWRVYALDNRGAAYTHSENSSSAFRYDNSEEGFLRVITQERVGEMTFPVGYVELKSEVVSGPTMSPLLFYTGSNGVQARVFSAGTYRITAVKEGYFPYTTTVTVSGGARDTANVTIPMLRPEAAVSGRVLAAADSFAVSAAKITAVSSWGDTVYSATDGHGGFMFYCRAADWSITVEKPGFQVSSAKRVTLKLGADTALGDVYLVKNPFGMSSVSGVIRNSSGQPVMGARVRVLRDGALADELASTPQNGSYVFYLNAGTYTITAEKPGFAMFSRGGVAVAGTTVQNITLRSGAVVVSGAIIGKSWVGSVNNYRAAPIASARVTFADVASQDTFNVTSDAVFGKFSVSLPRDRDYKVTVSAAGFAPSRNVRDFDTRRNVGGDLSKPYAENGRTDTLYALATIKGRVTGVTAEGVQVDVIVYDAAADRIIASGRVITSGGGGADVYEVRNIPDGSVNGDVRVRAGAYGYFTNTVHSINIRNGKLDPNGESNNGEFNFEMGNGYKNVGFAVTGYTGGGTVKLVSPFNRVLPFTGDAPGTVAWLDNAGDGEYAAGVVPKDTNRLELSYHKFTVKRDYDTVPLPLPFTYTAKSVADTSAGGGIKINWPAGPVGGPAAKRVELYYRSEGGARFDSIGANVEAGMLQEFRISKNVRDGSNLYHYFRVYLENGDIYGSSNQLYATYVRPNDKMVSHAAVEPEAAGGDTLVLPSSYKVEFTFKAFYGDNFAPILGNIGTVSWSVLGTGGAKGTGAAYPYKYTYVTPSDKQELVLQAVLTPSNVYKTKSGKPDTVQFPIRVTGQTLDSIRVLRKGDAGPIFNTGTAGFRIEAFDKGGKPVAVSPHWSVYPGKAGEIDSAAGSFTPSPDFVGMAGIAAIVGGKRFDYKDPDEKAAGQRVNYLLRRNGGAANTSKGMRVVFDTVRAGMNAHLEVTGLQLTNFVNRGTDSYRMADSVAFDVSFSDLGAVGGNVLLEFDIPKQLRGAAEGDYEFTVAKWFTDSLRWVPLDSVRVAGGVVSAWLSRRYEDEGLPKAKKVSAPHVSKASALAVSARYALVLKTGKTSLGLSISPHPFSPYIRPEKEYGKGAPLGTCIKVNVQAPDPAVKSVKVRIYNSTGKLVWGIEKLSAQTGENHFWWNGRTSGNGRASVSEDVWSENYYERNKDRPLCRNGRYYVMVIMTDMDGKQLRAAKPLVLMK